MLIKLSAYVLSEFGPLIADQKSPLEMFEALNKHFAMTSNETKAMLLSSFAKFCNNFPELCDYVLPVFDQYATHWNVDVQQRSNEYLNLANESIVQMKLGVLDPMPCYSEQIK